jgi:hypothetical protein
MAEEQRFVRDGKRLFSRHYSMGFVRWGFSGKKGAAHGIRSVGSKGRQLLALVNSPEPDILVLTSRGQQNVTSGSVVLNNEIE